MASHLELITDYARNRDIIRRQCDGLTHQQSLLQPPFRANCLNWTIGHIVVHRDKALETLGFAKVAPESVFGRYNFESDPITGEGPEVAGLEDLLGSLDQAQEALASALGSLGEKDMEAEVVSGGRTTTRYKRVHFLQFHDTYHTGQTELLRQLTGVDDKVL